MDVRVRTQPARLGLGLAVLMVLLVWLVGGLAAEAVTPRALDRIRRHAAEAEAEAQRHAKEESVGGPRDPLAVPAAAEVVLQAILDRGHHRRRKAVVACRPHLCRHLLRAVRQAEDAIPAL